jgi:sugar O-acyltransferase (sialic acid O-acetyltransferase NeuD family)
VYVPLSLGQGRKMDSTIASDLPGDDTAAEARHRLLRIYGAGGHANVVADAATSTGWKVTSYHADDASGRDMPGGVRPGLQAAGGDALAGNPPFIVAIGANAARRDVSNALRGPFAVVWHSSALITPGATIGDGSVVFHRSVLETRAHLGRHVILNTRSSVEQDAVVEDFAHVCPNAIVGRGATIGEGALIGAGAIIKPGVSVGAWATIGAGTVISHDVPAWITVVGYPRRIIRNADGERIDEAFDS